MEVEREWYLLRDGKRLGPFSDVDLDRFHSTKQLLPTDLLWHEGLSEWQPSAFFELQRDVPGLQSDRTQRGAAPQPVPRTRAMRWPTAAQVGVWRRMAIQVCVVLVCAVLLGAGIAKRAQKTSWDDPVMRAKLANAYVRAGGDDEKAARILGVTVGSARLAKSDIWMRQQLTIARKPPSGP